METTSLRDDLAALQSKATVENKVEITKKIAQVLEHHPMGGGNLTMAQQMISVLAGDAEKNVRATLASCLRHSPHLPREVALQLANDIESVSLPILTDSQILNEQDLITIIEHSGSAEKQEAIARREDVTETISASLVTHAKDDKVIATLLENASARISDTTINTIAETRTENAAVMGALAQREQIPIEIIQKITALVSDQIRDSVLAKIEGKYGMPASQLVSISDHSAGLSLLNILETRRSPADARALVDNLMGTHKLTANIFMSSLLIGKHHFAKYTISRLAERPLSVVEKYFFPDTMPADFEEALEKGDLVSSFAPDIFAIIKYAEKIPSSKTPKEFVEELYNHIQSQPNWLQNAHYFTMTLRSHPYFGA